MKKIILFAIGLLTSVTIFADDINYEYKGVTMTYEVSGSNATLKKGPTTSATVVEIPVAVEDGEHNSFTVTSIAQDAFLNNTDVNEVIISANITVIGKTAFKGCSQLKKITLPATLGTIGQDAFNGCSRLAHIWCKVTSPTSLNPTNLPSLSTTNMVTLYVSDKTAYENDDNWRPKFVNETFGNRIYKGEMKTVHHKNMWYVCASESKIATLYIGANETDVVIPDPDVIEDDEHIKYTVTGIDRNAFYGFNNIRRLTISKDVTTIGPNAFTNCSNISHVLCKVDDPTKLSPINLPSNEMMTLYVSSNGVQTLYKDENSSTWNTRFKNRIYVGDMTLVLYDGMWYICASDGTNDVATLYSGKNETNIVIPDNDVNFSYKVTGVDKSAFNGCSAVTSLTIPAIIAAIGPEAFRGCSNLAYFYSKSTSPFKINNNVFNNKAKVILYVPTTYQGIDGVTGWDGFLREELCDDMEVFQDNLGMTYVGWTNATTKEAILTKGISGSSDSPFTIPNTVTSAKSVVYNVTAIGDNAFNGVGLFKNLTVKSGIKTIGSNAFRGRTALQTITMELPYKLETIGDNAFNGCTSLTDVNFDNVQTIGASAFQGCSSLESIKLPLTLTSIGSKAFNGCNNLTVIESNMNSLYSYPSNVFPDNNIILFVPSNKSTYEENGWNTDNFLHVFEGGMQKTDGNLSYVYTNDGSGAVLLKSSSDNVTVEIENINGKTVKAIAKNAFLNNSNLSSVTFPNDCSIATIGKYAFKNCSKLNGINLPSSLRTIGEYAFENNTALTSIEIPEGTHTIRKYAFKKCSNLATVTLPATLSSIEDYAFDQCVSITTINSKIPGNENLFELKANVFSPYIVPTIYVTLGVGYYKTKEGWIKYKDYYRSGQKVENANAGTDINLFYDYYTDGNEATLVRVNTATGESFTIPATVELGEGENKKTYNVTAIGDNAFANTSNKADITTLTIGEKVVTIGANAFKDFTGLTTITLPVGVTAIGQSAFEGCTSLQSVTYTKNTNDEYNVSTIGSKAFKGCTSLRIELPASLKSIGDHAFEGNTALVSLTIPNNVTTIGAYAFKGCTSMTSLTLPPSLTSIGDNAFEDCNNSSFTSLIIKEGTETIGMNAFKNCSKLESIELPPSLTKIDVGAFADCANLKNIKSGIDKDHIFDIDETVFPNQVYLDATVFVPIHNVPVPDPNAPAPDPETLKRTEDKYRETKGWKLFNEIIEGEKGETTINYLVYEYITGKGEATLIRTTFGPTIDNDGVVSIPDKLEIGPDNNKVYYDVVEIAESAFSSNENTRKIKKLTISDNVETIGASAFKDCSGLIEIVLPLKLKTIGNSAFEGCSNLKGLELPSGITTIGDNTFKGCSGLAEIELPSDLTSIGASAFQNCSSLQKVWLHAMLTIIGNNVFNGCANITHVCSEIVNPSSINENVFNSLNENNTATLFIPKNSNYTGGWISKISNVVEGHFKGFYKAATGDENGMTISCYTIDEEEAAIITKAETSSAAVNIPETVNPGETVAGGPYKVRIIGKKAFKDRTSIKRVTLPANLTAIGDNAFVGCTNLTEVESNIQTPFNIVKSKKFPESATNTLYVPYVQEVDKAEAYRNAGWTFDNILNGARKEETINKIKYLYAEYGTTATIISSETSNENPIIPDAVPNTNKKVVAIADGAFKGNTKLDHVELPDGLVTIGKNAFENCTGLRYVTLPANLTAIGDDAFKDCSKLTDVDSQIQNPFNITNKGTIFPTNAVNLYIPNVDGIEALYETANWNFENKYKGKRIETTIDNLTYVYAEYGTTATIIKSKTDNTNPEIPATVPETDEKVRVTAITESAFENNKLLPYLVVPENVISIGVNAFKGCEGIKVVTLPASLETIGNGAFSGCSLLTDVDSRREIPIAITKSNIFPDCAVSLYVPKDKMSDYYNAGWEFAIRHNGKRIEETKDNITYLYAEYEPNATIIGNKVAVATLEIPANVPELIIPGTTEDKVYVTSIAESAFSGNTYLVSLKLPDELKTIGDYAFQNCRNLQRVWLPSKLTDIGAKAFNGCKSLNRVSTKALPDVENKDVFPVNIEYLFIPESSNVTGMPGWGSFHRTVKGEYIGDMTTAEEITYICMKNGEGDGTKRSAILWKSTNTPSSIESSVAYKGDTYEVTTIGEKVFSGKSFESLQLPNGITTIDAEAFKGCKSLKTLELPSTLKTIGANAFNGCTALKQVELPSSLTSISKNAFDGCTNLTEVVCKIESADVIKGNPISLPYATLYVANNKDSYKKDLGWEYLHILEGDRKLWEAKNGLYYAYSTVDKKALLIDSKIEETDDDITIPGKITAKEDALAVTCDVIAIDKSVFSGNTNVKTVKIEDGIQTIGAYAFQGCSNLKMIELPKSLTSIGQKAFDGCKNLTEVVCKIEDADVIKNNPQSLPNATLYVHEGTSGHYGEWKCAHIYEGARIVTPQGGLYYAYTKGAGETIVVGADISAGENITIPGSITIGEGESAENYAVVAINDEAFSGNTDIKSVKIGEKIQTIGANAFQGCTNLQKIWLPSTLTKIGEKAFDGCNSIAYICTSSKTPLESPNFSKNVFSSYNATLFVPDGDAESNYKSKDFWKSFTMKVGYLVDVKSQDNLIYECVTNGDVATATLVKSETTVADVAIPSIIKLDNDTHDYKVTAIRKQVFKGNGNVVTLKIGENVKTIEDEAFMNCGKLQKVWLPSTLESIGNKAFNGSKSITRVSTKTKTMPSLGSEVFSTSTAYLFVPKGTESSWSGFAKVVEGHFVGDVTKDNISYICIESGSATEKTAMLIKGPKTASAFASSVVLDSETYPLTTICESAFEDNTALVNLVIPDGVKAIEANAFKNSTKLLTVELPASLEKIGDNAFQGCSLVYIQNLAETPVTISENVFTDAVYNNATLYVPDNASENYDVEVWKKFTIVEGIYSEVSIEGMTYLCVTSQDKLVARVTKGLSKTKEVKIPAKIFIGGLNYQVQSVEKSAFEGYNTLEKVIVAEGIKTIGEAVFKECTNLKSVVLPASLESIGDYAFESCAGLETVTCAGETPVNINKNVFSVTKLEVNVPTRSSVSAYKEHTIWGAFEILYSMSSTSGSDGTENVDVATYQLVTPEGNDVTTTSVAIVDDDNVKGDFVIPTTVTRNGTPYTVTTIAPSAFEGNIELISVSLPPTVTSIGTGAFAGCENMQSMTVNNTVPPTLISTSTVASARRMFTRGADDSPIFKGVDVENCILYVPEESIEKYSQSDIWGVFKNIRAISATGMSGVIVQDGTPFDVYNLQGRKVKSGVTTLKGLTPGVYIVRGKKVAIR